VPVIFNLETTYQFGKWIGARNANQKNLIWVISGDRNPRKNSQDTEVWVEIARGIRETQSMGNKQLMSFHPQPTAFGSSSNWFHQ
jgi:hypothetical protein